jgi:DNA mismatch repair protein MutS
VAIAAADISTGRFELIETDAGARRRARAAERRPSHRRRRVRPSPACHRRTRPRVDFDSGVAETRLKRLFGVATLDGFGAVQPRRLAAAGGLVAYLDRAAKGALPFLRPPRRSPCRRGGIWRSTRRPAKAWS